MKSESTFAWKFLRTLVRPMARLLFDLKVDGRDNIPAEGGALIVSNHQSYLDPILMPLQLDRPLNYIAKSELFGNPVAAWILQSVFNAFPVHQGHIDVRAVKETILRLQEGHLLNIYPEGSRTSDGEIAPLQAGVALIVERTHVPVVPAVIVGAFDAWPIQRKLPRTGSIRIRFGQRMDLTQMHRDEIILAIDRKLREMFELLKSEMAQER